MYRFKIDPNWAKKKPGKTIFLADAIYTPPLICMFFFAEHKIILTPEPTNTHTHIFTALENKIINGFCLYKQKLNNAYV